MAFTIRKAAVIGAGTMGAGIAAHLANAGLQVDLLDVVPERLTEGEEARGLSLADPRVRSRVAVEAIDRIGRAFPPPLFTAAAARRIRPGNIEDDLARLREADWIIEAVVERLDVKRAIVARIEPHRRPDAIVSTNTSGIPIRAVAKEASSAFKAHFLGTHFFNPPRYMKLLELIPLAETRPEVVDAMRDAGERILGKGVALCKDTPNFIANRYAAMAGAMVLNLALANGLTVEEVDAVTGPATGRPKTATFRLLDLVGVDIAALVNQNLHALVREDECRDELVSPRTIELFSRMIERGLLGDKTGQGFYRKLPKARGGAILTLDLETLEYRERRDPTLPSLAAAARLPLGERWRFFVAQDDPVGALARQMRRALAYMSMRVPEICDDYPTVDRVIRWGFNHECGPFETWDLLGVGETLDAFDREGTPVAPWVRDMLAQGQPTFYRFGAGRVAYFDVGSATVVHEPASRRIVLDRRRAAHAVVRTSASASLVDLGDDVLCLEVHSKLNTLDDDVVAMMRHGAEALAGRWVGLVIGNDGADFGVGANLVRLLQAVEGGRFGDVDDVVRQVQEAMQAIRTAPGPVVAAPFGRVLGGCCEIVLAASRAVAAAETYIGLVEIGVGLLPAAGGCKEMVRRHVSPAMLTPGTDPLPLVQAVLQTLGLAKVSSSADDARTLGYLSPTDRIVMNRDDVLADAKAEVLAMVARGYRAPSTRGNCFAAGRGTLATLETGLYLMEQGGYATSHDRHAATKIAGVLCGGDLTSPQWVDEQYLLDLEREAFVSLCGEPKTVERIQYMLKTGKPLRN
ncbi:MAG: 3-hydroxyacyl-CoA dehydrogenase/enoyl-CoA hydratase family protein [Vicinamibacterales bacterium]